MPDLTDRLMDRVLTLIRRHLRLEVCAVDEVHNHKEPGDEEFNYVTVVMRDRSQKDAPPRRERIPVWQNILGGHCGGYNWNPRKGDLVYCFFWGERKGVVLCNYWSWAQYPVCRPGPYDIADKNGQWMEPYQDIYGDFPREPYPMLKKPYCFRWFHGPVTGSTGKGRDWLWLFDFCKEGDTDPTCQGCDNIDCVARTDNHGFKFYSKETESELSPPSRGIYFVPCGAYWMLESEDVSPGVTSEVFTAGKGFWTIQGAMEIDQLKGHARHYPDGDMEIHSATSSNDDTGARCAVSAPGSTLWAFAAELKDFVTGAFIHILKTGKILANSPSEVELEAPTITLDGNVVITGSCTHNACSCDNEFAKLGGVAGGQTLCGGTEVAEVLTLCGTSDGSKGQVTIDADLECTGDLCSQIQSAIIELCNTAYPQSNGVSGGQMLCGGIQADEVLTLCGTADASKGQVTVDADLECTGDLCTQIKAAIKAYCDTLYAATGSGVTNGDDHNHSGGDGGQISYASLSDTPVPVVFHANSGGTTHTANSAFQKVSGWDVVFDPNSRWDSDNQRWAAPYTGYYRMSMHVSFVANSSGTQRLAGIAVNGNLVQMGPRIEPHASCANSVIVTCIVYVNADDTIEGQAYQNSGGNLNYDTSNALDSSFDIELIR